MKRLGFGAAAALLALTCLAPGQAAALTLDDFISITGPEGVLFFDLCVIEGQGLPNSSQADLDALELAVAVSLDSGADGAIGGSDDRILVEFVNASPISSAITDIYFDDGSSRGGLPLIQNGSVFDWAGTNVSFTQTGDPPNLPSGGALDPTFVANPALSFFATDPAAHDGVNSGENLVLAYELAAAPGTIGAALLSGDLRIGVHVQSIGATEDSDAFYACPRDNPPPPNDPVPEPATVLLFGMGATFLVVRMHF